MKQRIVVGYPHGSMRWYTNLLSPHSTLYDRTSGKGNHGTSPHPRPFLTKGEDQLHIIETKHTVLEQWVWPVYWVCLVKDSYMVYVLVILKRIVMVAIVSILFCCTMQLFSISWTTVTWIIHTQKSDNKCDPLWEKGPLGIFCRIGVFGMDR